MGFVPSMERVIEGSELRTITLGHPLVDAYLEFVGARGAVNTWLATAYDLKVFFAVVGKEPAEVTSADVFGFLGQQRTPRYEKGAGLLEGLYVVWGMTPRA
jgi:integrase/recombinase XerD